jgi:hypothetical protein
MGFFGEKYGKTMRQLWEKNYGKTIWGNYNYGKPILKKPWETYGKNEHVEFQREHFGTDMEKL